MKLKADSTTNASTSDQRAFQVAAQTIEALQYKRDELENTKDGKENQVRGITSIKQQRLLLGSMCRLTANKQTLGSVLSKQPLN